MPRSSPPRPDFPSRRPGSPFQPPISPPRPHHLPSKALNSPSVPQIPPSRTQYLPFQASDPLSGPHFSSLQASDSPPAAPPWLPSHFPSTRTPSRPPTRAFRMFMAAEDPGAPPAPALPSLSSLDAASGGRIRHSQSALQSPRGPHPHPTRDWLNRSVPRFMDRRTVQSESKMSGRLRPHRRCSQPTRNDQDQLRLLSRMQSAPGGSQSHP